VPIVGVSVGQIEFGGLVLTTLMEFSSDLLTEVPHL